MVKTRPPWRRRIARIAIDISPLRDSPAYRILWVGQLVSLTGSQLRHVVIAYHVYVLTESPLAVGLIGAFQAGPLIAFSLWGGVIADAVDRRKLILFTQAGLIAVMGGLALGTQLGIAEVWYIYLLTAVSATLFALDAPARQSLIPTLVERRQIPAAMALNQVLFQTSMVLGPVLGGLVLGRYGIAAGYWIDAATFAAGFLSAYLLRVSGRTPGGASPGFKSLVEGLRYVRGSQLLLSIMALDFVAMFFGWPRAMFPFFADKVFGVGEEGLGLMFAAPGFGALIGALSAGWVSRVRRQGAAVLGSVFVWGLAVAGFGALQSGFLLGLFFLAVAGAADVVSAILRGTMIQMAVPDHLRGRITAMNLMVVISGPRLGEVESGVVADVVTPRFSVVSGGLACVVAAALILFLVPSLRSFEIKDQDRFEQPPA